MSVKGTEDEALSIESGTTRPSVIPDNDGKLLVEMYRQAHEMRRRWEIYIWQYGLFATAVAAFLFNVIDFSTESFPIFQKVIVSLVALFSLTILTNVYRARELMKEIEISIKRIHNQAGYDFAIVPLELNDRMRGLRRISSTRIAFLANVVFSISLIFLAIFVWDPDFINGAFGFLQD
jgi:hypothetical protein